MRASSFSGVHINSFQDYMISYYFLRVFVTDLKPEFSLLRRCSVSPCLCLIFP